MVLVSTCLAPPPPSTLPPPTACACCPSAARNRPRRQHLEKNNTRKHNPSGGTCSATTVQYDDRGRRRVRVGGESHKRNSDEAVWRVSRRKRARQGERLSEAYAVQTRWVQGRAQGPAESGRTTRLRFGCGSTACALYSCSLPHSRVQLYVRKTIVSPLFWPGAAGRDARCPYPRQACP